MQLKRVKVELLKPNPYRNVKEYPLREEKLEAIEDSIRNTGFWGNIVCRPNGKGYEIAYGHHRLEVLSKVLKMESVQVLVEKLSNERMLQMQSRENHEAYGSDAWVEMEDIRQTIEAYDRGEIKLPAVDKGHGAVEYSSPTSENCFTKLQIARFLGRTKQEGKEGDYGFEKAWKALDMIESGILLTSQFKGLKREDMAVITAVATKAKGIFERTAKAYDKAAREAETPGEKSKLESQAEKLRSKATTEAKKAAKTAEEKIRAGEGVRAAREVTVITIPQPRKVEDVDGLAGRVAKSIAKILEDGKDLSEKLKFLKKYKDEASDASLRAVCSEFKKLSSRIEKCERSLGCRSK